ncbi:MAG: error-prone DNA polymerase [Oligoflexus sp.]
MASLHEDLVWHEWLCHTNFSFLLGASHPEDYLSRAAELGYAGIGICDFDGLYGIVRAHRFWQNLQQERAEQALPLLFYGAELHLAADHHLPLPYRDTIVLKACTWQGYRTLCQIINLSHQRSKHEPYLAADDLLQFPTAGLIAIQPMRGLVRKASYQATAERYDLWRQHFSERFFLAISRHLSPAEDHWIPRTLRLADDLQIPTLLSQDAFFHDPREKDLSDIVQAIRLNRAVADCVPYLFVNKERSLADKLGLIKRYQSIPGFHRSLKNSEDLAAQFRFSLDQLRYQYPQEMIPSGYDAQSYLEFLVWQSTYRLYPNPSRKILTSIQGELQLIATLRFADYFLTVWDIVRWARAQGILCQGRGSAANSAVCFVLGITAVDPALFELLFERFISLERGDPPDIDIDFEHERREEVIQYIYHRYGRQRAAMVANVITFRSRGAIRAVGKALGLDDKTLQQAAKMQDMRAVRKSPSTQTLATLEAAATDSIPWQLWGDLAERLKGFPRHLGIHSGGFIISHEPLDCIVPQEPATMVGRTVIQWSKDDIEALSLFKIDILALGMLTALRKCFTLIRKHYGQRLDLACIPHDDPATYKMIQAAATVGTFQIESRAQMSMLPRHRPEKFYDLVVQVGIIRPGPIQGGLIHPYLRRRHGLEPVTYPHPKLENILKRTLGVPIFQEQVMRVAMTVGDFSPGEADQLRKQIGSWSLNKDLGPLIGKLEVGMRRHGIAEQEIQQALAYLKGFADYGFPESHAASFALLAYASAYLKRHFQAAFYTAILNSQPMGFYSIHALLRSAMREGTMVLPVSVQLSDWDSRLETYQKPGQEPRLAIRLGLRLVKRLSYRGALALIKEREQRQWQSLEDFLREQPLHRGDLTALAAANALSDWGLDRRAAIWIAEAAPFAPLLEEDLVQDFPAEDLMSRIERDFESFGSTLACHPAQLIKEEHWVYPIPIASIPRAKDLAQLGNQRRVTVFGMVLVRQCPATAKGMIFFTMEDESGFLNLAFPPPISERYRKIINGQGFLCVSGTLQLTDGGAHSILVDTVHAPQDERPKVIPLHHKDWLAEDGQASAATASKQLVRSRNYM